MSLRLRSLARRVAQILAARPAGPAARDGGSVWDRPLGGDAWIGVFLIVVSLLGMLELAQRF